MRLAVAIVVVLVAPSAFAQSPSRAADALAAFDRGVVRMQAGAWEEARVEFGLSLSLQSTQAALVNLATCQSRLDRPADAASTLDRFLREFGERGNAELVARVRRDLAALEPRVGRARLQASRHGAELFVDGVSMGRSPLLRPLFVVPGQHRFEARLDGHKSAVVDASVEPRTVREIMLDLQPLPIVATRPNVSIVLGPGPEVPPARSRATSRGSAGTWFAVFTTTSGLAFLTALSGGLYVLVDGANYKADEHRTLAHQERGRTITLLVDVSFGVSIATAVVAAIFYSRSNAPPLVTAHGR